MENTKRQRTSRLTRAAKERDDSLQRFVSDASIRSSSTEDGRRFELSFSSEEPYERIWGTEILSHAEDAVDLTRLNSIGVVLFNHDRDRVIGRIVRAWLEDGRGKAEIEFDTDADAETIRQKVAGGTLKSTSVGYMVSEWEEVRKDKVSEDGRFNGPCDIARKWTPYEISIVSVPADPTVGVGRSHQDAEMNSKKGVSSFYYHEKQLQINKNLQEGGKRDES